MITSAVLGCKKSQILHCPLTVARLRQSLFWCCNFLSFIFFDGYKKRLKLCEFHLITCLEGGNGKCCMKVVSKCCAAVSSAVDTNFLFVLFLSLTSIGFPPISVSLVWHLPNPSFSLHPFTCTSLSCRCAGWDRKKKKFTSQSSPHYLETKQESFDFFDTT